MSTIQNLRNSLDRNRRPVCSVGGGGFSGAEFAHFPYPLPPTFSGDGPALLWSFSVPFRDLVTFNFTNEEPEN